MPDMIFPDALYLSIEQSDKRGLVLYTGELMREFGAGVLVCEGIRLLGMVGTHRGQLQGKWGMTGEVNEWKNWVNSCIKSKCPSSN